MGIDEDFQAAADDATKKLPSNMSNEDKAEMYALFKQATVGDINIERPGLFDQKGRYKWDAWEKKKGISKEDAMLAYIAFVTSLKEKYGV